MERAKQDGMEGDESAWLVRAALPEQVRSELRPECVCVGGGGNQPCKDLSEGPRLENSEQVGSRRGESWGGQGPANAGPCWL